jgi:transposase
MAMRTYPELKLILELWEQGMSKKSIAFKTGIPRGTVTDCIKRYGTVGQLEAVMRGESTQLPDFSDTNQKRVYALPSLCATPTQIYN